MIGVTQKMLYKQLEHLDTAVHGHFSVWKDSGVAHSMRFKAVMRHPVLL